MTLKTFCSFFFTCSREEKQTCLSDTQWDIFKLTHGNEPRTSTGRTVWLIWEKIVCAAGSNSTWCLLTSDGQSEASWNTEAFVQELYWSVKTIWNHLHSDTCWPIWLWIHLDDTFLWYNDKDKSCTTPNKTTFYTRLSVIMIIAWFGEILTQTRKEKHWDC